MVQEYAVLTIIVAVVVFAAIWRTRSSRKSPSSPVIDVVEILNNEHLLILKKN